MQVENPPPRTTSRLPSLTGVPPGSKIVAELLTTLDVLATRSGDEIAVRVTKNLKQGGRMVVHEGDRLVGRVTSVRPQSVGKGQISSEIDILFDRLTSGANSYRLNAVIHSVVWIPRQAGDAATGTNLTQTTSQHAQGLRGPHPGLGTGQGTSASHGEVGDEGENTANNIDFPGRPAAPLDSIEAGSRRAPDGRAGGVSVLTDREGNLRLSAGTRMDFRTQSP